MKKLTAIIIILTATLACFAGNGRKESRAEGGAQADRLISLIAEYRYKDGFDVVKIGRLGTSAIKSLAKIGAWAEGDGEDAKALKDVIGGLKKLAIVDYEDCSETDRHNFERKVGRILREEDTIMEFKDNGEICKIYGVMDESSDKLRNFILYNPSDCALICLFGSISLSKVISAMDR